MLRDSLVHVALHVNEATHAQLWEALSKDERRLSLEAALSDPLHRGWARPWIANLIVKSGGGWRLAKLLEAPQRELADRATRLRISQRDGIDRLLRALYLGPWIAIQAEFFDRAGVKHQGGVLVEEEESAMGTSAPVVSLESLKLAVSRVLTSQGDRGLIYLIALRLLSPDRWLGIATALSDELTPHEARPTALAKPADPSDESPQSAPSPRLTAVVDLDLSGLDDLMTLAVLTGAAAVHGHPSLNELGPIVEEYAHQNTLRHQSWYVVGFRDALANEAARDLLEGENESRRRWYLAGYLDGLARGQRNEEILSLLPKQPTLVSLRHWKVGAERRLGERLALAMADLRRLDDLARFVTSDLAGVAPAVYSAVRMAARDTLAERRLPQCVKLLEIALAAKAGDNITDSGDTESADHELLELQRHIAHCHRLMGSFDLAREAILRLIPSLDELDPERASMLHVDLGLMAASLKELADLRLPTARVDFAQRATDLMRAEEHWMRALGDNDDLTYGHAHYALGFLYLVREDFSGARTHLQQAVHAFIQKPDVYARGTLLRDAKAHAALAVCLEYESVTAIEAGARDLAEAVDDGFHIPTGLATDLLAAFDNIDSEIERQFLEALLRRYRSERLGEFEASGALSRSLALRQAFCARATDQGQPITTRVNAAYAVLPELLRCGDRDNALAVIDVIFAAALDGVVPERFLLLTEQPGALSPAVDQQWDSDWYRARVLLAMMRPDDAVVVLDQAFARAIARGGAHGLADAAEIAEMCEQIVGPDHAVTEYCRTRLASVTPSVPSEPTKSPRPVRVLFIGGDETQAQYGEQLRAELGRTEPWITVRFYHTFWKQQWNTQVEDVKRLLPEADAVVISRFIRTTFGAHVRAACDGRPWRLCGGTGRGSMRQSILLVAEMAVAGD